jgi:hypothetical protein
VFTGPAPRSPEGIACGCFTAPWRRRIKHGKLPRRHFAIRSRTGQRRVSSDVNGLHLYCYGIVNNKRRLKMGAAFCGRSRHGQCAKILSFQHGYDEKFPEDTNPLGRQCQRLPRLPHKLGPPVVTTGTQCVSFPRQFFRACSSAHHTPEPEDAGGCRRSSLACTTPSA